MLVKLHTIFISEICKQKNYHEKIIYFRFTASYTSSLNFNFIKGKRKETVQEHKIQN